MSKLIHLELDENNNQVPKEKNLYLDDVENKIIINWDKIFYYLDDGKLYIDNTGELIVKQLSLKKPLTILNNTSNFSTSIIPYLATVQKSSSKKDISSSIDIFKEWYLLNMFKNFSEKKFVNLEDTNSPIKLIRPLSGGKSGAFVFQADYILSMFNPETIGSVGTNIAKTAITYSIVEGSKRTFPTLDKVFTGIASLVDYSKINQRIYKYNENVKRIVKYYTKIDDYRTMNEIYCLLSLSGKDPAFPLLYDIIYIQQPVKVYISRYLSTPERFNLETLANAFNLFEPFTKIPGWSPIIGFFPKTFTLLASTTIKSFGLYSTWKPVWDSVLDNLKNTEIMKTFLESWIGESNFVLISEFSKLLPLLYFVSRNTYSGMTLDQKDLLFLKTGINDTNSGVCVVTNSAGKNSLSDYIVDFKNSIDYINVNLLNEEKKIEEYYTYNLQIKLIAVELIRILERAKEIVGPNFEHFDFHVDNIFMPEFNKFKDDTEIIKQIINDKKYLNNRSLLQNFINDNRITTYTIKKVSLKDKTYLPLPNIGIIDFDLAHMRTEPWNDRTNPIYRNHREKKITFIPAVSMTRFFETLFDKKYTYFEKQLVFSSRITNNTDIRNWMICINSLFLYIYKQNNTDFTERIFIDKNCYGMQCIIENEVLNSFDIGTTLNPKYIIDDIDLDTFDYLKKNKKIEILDYYFNFYEKFFKKLIYDGEVLFINKPINIDLEIATKRNIKTDYPLVNTFRKNPISSQTNETSSLIYNSFQIFTQDIKRFGKRVKEYPLEQTKNLLKYFFTDNIEQNLSKTSIYFLVNVSKFIKLDFTLVIKIDTNAKFKGNINSLAEGNFDFSITSSGTPLQMYITSNKLGLLSSTETFGIANNVPEVISSSSKEKILAFKELKNIRFYNSNEFGINQLNIDIFANWPWKQYVIVSFLFGTIQKRTNLKFLKDLGFRIQNNQKINQTNNKLEQVLTISYTPMTKLEKDEKDEKDEKEIDNTFIFEQFLLVLDKLLSITNNKLTINKERINFDCEVDKYNVEFDIDDDVLIEESEKIYELNEKLYKIRTYLCKNKLIPIKKESEKSRKTKASKVTKLRDKKRKTKATEDIKLSDKKRRRRKRS